MVHDGFVVRVRFVVGRVVRPVPVGVVASPIFVAVGRYFGGDRGPACAGVEGLPICIIVLRFDVVVVFRVLNEISVWTRFTDGGRDKGLGRRCSNEKRKDDDVD